ncbi:hypothetical protein L798_15449 [Zootermopsis nevadensis]|uniref:Uncharacterized protein n=1 Tax=Zootermopsis nevadensis TaxID=136037 RepID=A0A067QMJ2_ZOONE|nr:hypothetical protein L798_15449 [Zootermopsis nevadensis]
MNPIFGELAFTLEDILCELQTHFPRVFWRIKALLAAIQHLKTATMIFSNSNLNC